jgi:release factor glutamine methyltransferase
MKRIALGRALDEARQKIEALDARVLLCHVVDKDSAYLVAHADAVLKVEQYSRFTDLVRRRAAGEPVAYLTGKREFFGRSFNVSPDVLIPRPETELLVELTLARLSGEGVNEVLDLGTGSGCIGLSIVSEDSHCRLTMSDQSLNALAIAEGNAERLGLGGVRAQRSDWFEALGERRFNLIVSNPPYVSDDDRHLSQGDLRFEPRSALVGGRDGLDCIRSIVAGAPHHLVPGGWLLLEHGHDQATTVRALLQAAGFSDIFSARDLAGIERVSGGVLTSSVPQS